jgi:ABC-type multidrug transport system fused ATPase/permease subunit
MKQGCDIATDWWLSSWSQDKFSMETIDYIWVYSGLSLASMVFSYVRTLAMIFGCLSASKSLHDGMLSRILLTPIAFFDVTPIGRIINRFSGDINQIDETIPVNIQQFLVQSFILIGVIAVQTVVSPFFLALLIPIAIAYHKIQSYFRPTSREIKRLKNISRSPVLAHFSETLTGVMTIRAFNMQVSILYCTRDLQM